MFKAKISKKMLKGFMSRLLALLIAFSFITPIIIMASPTGGLRTQGSGEEAATGSHIYAFLNLIDKTKTGSKRQEYNLELVFKNENKKDDNYYAGPYTDFADTVYATTTYKFDSNGRPSKTWNYNQWSPGADSVTNRLPWSVDSNKGVYIRKVRFDNRIAPKSIAGWFYNMRSLVKFENFENLDVSQCENMAFAFWYMDTDNPGNSIMDNGENLSKKYMKSLDLSGWDTSKCQNFDCFLNSSLLENLDISNFSFAGLNDNIVDVAGNGTVKYNDAGKRTSGYPAYTGAMRTVTSFVHNAQALQTIKLDNMDFADIEFLNSFIVNTGLTKIDLSKVKNDPIHITSAESVFNSNSKLTEIIFGEEGNPFEIGTEPMYLGYPRNGGIDPFRPNDKNGSGEYFENGYKNNMVWLGAFISSCSSLERIDLQYLRINGFGKKADGTSYPANSPDYGKTGFDRNNANLGSGLKYQLNSFFANCTALESIDNLDSLGFNVVYAGTWNTRTMFQNCKSLEEIDLSGYWANLGGPNQFQNCTSLKKLDLSNMGRSMITSNYWYCSLYDTMSKGFQSYNSDNGTKANVFEGCTELSEVSLSPYYYGAVPQAYRKSGDQSRTAVTADQVLKYTPNNNYSPIEKDIPPVDPDALWIKIKDPEEDAFQLSALNGYYYTSNTDTGMNVALESTDLYPVNGAPLTTLELFGDYKPHYAGTWVRTSKIALVSKGATPTMQTIDGAVGLEVNYDPSKIEDPVRPGYEFLGWYAKDENGVEKKLDEQLAANKDSDPNNDEVFAAWSYTAKWREHKYNLVLNGNLGTTTIHNEQTDEDETVDSYTAKENLLYSEYFELNNTMFTRSGYVLSGWNTRPNGSGDEYAANESVAKLSTVDGATVTLYAQWHRPDLILHFDANYENAPAMPDKNYTLETGKTTYYGDLAEATRNGYTFGGWYTAREGGTKITSNMEVNTQYDTLYAHWYENPVVTFNANGGYFETKSGTSPTVIRQYKYNQNYGVIPTAVNNNAVLKGWYTNDGTGGDWGNEITSAADNGGTAIASASDKVAKETKTYYARWGYQPEFESNGGVYKTYGNYPIQDSDQYVIASYTYAENNPSSTIPTLPTFKNEEGFEGWWFNGENITEYLETHDTYTIDMSHGKTVEAHWETKDVYEVTLHTDGGSLPMTYVGDNNGTEYYRVRVYAGNKVEELPVPTKSDGSTVYEFLGWYTQEMGGEKVDYNFVPSGNCDLYARWASKSITVNFDAGSGTLYLPSDESMTVYSGGRVKYLPGANRTGGYVFGGWYSDLNDESTKLTTETAITSNTTYYAKWISVDGNSYTEIADDDLYQYTVKWDTDSNEYATNIGDDLIIAPKNGNAALSATVFIRFYFDKVAATDTNGELPVGSVKIKVPKYIFKTKDGQNVGSNNISNGLSKTNTANCHFIYDDSDPEYYIITNYVALNKDSTYNDQVFQIDYKLEPSDLRRIDGGRTDENGYYGGNYYTKTFPVSVEVDRNLDGDLEDAHETDYAKNLSLEVHTNVSASTSKTRSTVYFEWQEDSWGPAPQDANQYFYVVWDLTASFDSKNSQRFKFYWSEDTVHDGSVVMMNYGSNYSESDYMGPGTYHTTVVTKHPRKTTDSGWKTVYNEAVLNIESLSGYKQQMRVSREDGVYLIPSGPGRIFEKQIYGYDKGTADRIKSGGTELILNRSGVDGLKYEIDYEEHSNSDPEKVWYPTSKTYSVDERNIEITDGAKGQGDVVMSKVTGNDKYNWNCSSNVSLSDADYSFTNLDIYLTEYDAVQVNGDWSEPYVHSAIRDYGDVEIWVRGENDNDFRLFKTLTASDFHAPSTEDDEMLDYGAALASSITLPERTAGYKIVHNSSFYTTKMMVCPTLFLRSTNKVYSFVQENMLNNVNTLIKNSATMSVDNETRDSKRLESGGAYICSYELKTDESYLYVTKKCAEDKTDSSGNDYYQIDAEAGTQEFPVLISAWGLNRAGSTKLMQSGVFYDLLPYNFTVDKSTIFVTARKEKNTTNSASPHSYSNPNTSKNKFPSSLYSVDFVENWEGSGRTMMIVTITGIPDNLPSSYTNAVNGFNVYYKMKTTMSNVLANGTTQKNYVAFTDTTENQTVPVSKYDVLSNQDQKVIPYYRSINDANKEFTAYNSDSTHCKMPVQHTRGFNSSVKAEGVFMMEEKTVGLSSDYSYNVTFTDGKKAATDIVIYDVIENSYNGSNCEWRGTFQSVDVSAIENMEDDNSTTSDKIYCAPKVYYLVKDGSVTSEDLDIDNSPYWSETVPSDNTTVKAIAIDCRKATNNGSFTLPGEKALSFNISMHSPDTSEENDLVTRNEAIVHAVVDDMQYTSRDITNLTLHYADPLIRKDSFPESGKDADHREGAVNGSTIEYSLIISNPDDYVPIRNITVEDLLDAKLKVNSSPKVSKGDEEPVPIGSAAGITYSIDTQTGGRDKFTATISHLDPGETMTIIVPATVTDAANGYTIDNTAYITSANGSSMNLESNTTYHYVTNTQAKIKKVDTNGNGLAGASLQILNSDKTQVLVDNITSTTDVMSFDLVPGDYVLHEVSSPNNEHYKIAADIPFSIDIEGINKVNNKSVSHVEMVDEPAYKIVFHENRPNHDDEVYKVYGPADLKSGKIEHFYDIPSFAGDEYVFAGWYHASGYTTVSNDSALTTAANFESDTYQKTDDVNPADYHLYAKWIEVGKVDSQNEEDTFNYGDAGIRGFGLAGVEIRDPQMSDTNYNKDDTETMPGGLRFVTSLSESLLTDIKGLSNQDVEYGYVVATEDNIKDFIRNYKVSDVTKYKLEFNGRNVNGVDTTGLNENNERFETDGEDNKVLARKDLTAANDFVYVTNVNCTKGTGSISRDHRNYPNYRLYTLIVTYEGDDSNKKDQKIDARSYLRYTDANGKVRIFYNNYKKNLYYGGCLSSFNQAKSLARPTDSEWIG